MWGWGERINWNNAEYDASLQSYQKDGHDIGMVSEKQKGNAGKEIYKVLDGETLKGHKDGQQLFSLMSEMRSIPHQRVE